MLRKQQWKVEPGLGAERLETIQSQVLLSNALRPYLDDLALQARLAAESTNDWIVETAKASVKTDNVLGF